MKKFSNILAVAVIALSLGQTVLADNDFHGIVESRPEGKVGTWIIGGRPVEVTPRTDLEADHGPVDVGSCVEVDFYYGNAGEVAGEIESRPDSWCRRQ